MNFLFDKIFNSKLNSNDNIQKKSSIKFLKYRLSGINNLEIFLFCTHTMAQLLFFSTGSWDTDFPNEN